MRWSEALAIAGRDVSRRRARVALTVVAVTLAATLLTALLLIAETARTRVLDQLSKGGPLAGIRVTTSLDRADVVRMRRLPDVDAVLPVLSTDAVVVPTTRPDDPLADVGRVRLVGADLRQPGKLPITVLAGRLPSASTRTEVAVAQSFYERLGLTEKEAAGLVGREVAFGVARSGSGGGDATRWSRAAVVGVVAQEAAPGELLAPLVAVEDMTRWAENGSTTRFDGAFVVADRLGRVAAARQQLARLGLPSTAPENLIASVQRYLHVVEIVLGSIGVIALVIAALGIANALFASVRERRREIGVLKAIGARDGDIRRIFLLEATALGAGGGAVGTVLGWAVSRIVGAAVNGYLTSHGIAGVTVQFPVRVLVLGVVGSTVLALVAGTIPAVQAARLPAREALGET